MTLRKLWLWILILVAVVAIAVNAVIFTFLTERYFSDYLKESYKLHVEQIVEYTTSALTSDEISYDQMAIELESHLNDPIIGIKLYKPDGKLLLNVDSDYHINGGMMNGMMGGHMMGRRMEDTSEEVQQIDIVWDNRVIAIMNITLHSIAENSFVARRFKSALLTNSLYAIGIAIAIALIVGIIVSRKMSRSLKNTEQLASDIQLGREVRPKPTGIKEVNAIQHSLMDLHARLRLKQKTRKSLVDQLIHQTRTPLTILKSHIEAIEDGVIHVDEKELQICQDQISDITTIISNMGSMIEAEKDTDELKVEAFDFTNMLKQIRQGLLAQFRKKNITIEMTSNESIQLVTDKYKLSQGIYNLLINAYKYTMEHGLVRISYITVDEQLIIKIQDTGIGISEKEQDKIFHAYYRSPSVVTEKGDGIGLYIVKENIQRLKGTVEVESKLGVGSTFTIRIPMNLG